MFFSHHKNPIRHGAMCILLSGSLILAGCGGGAGRAPELPSNPSAAETELHDRSAAMTKTIVEAIAVGALAGAAVGLFDRDVDGNAYGELGLGGYLLAGALAGAVAGTYVGFLQRDFANKEARLERARADIRANNAETLATLQVMQRVLDQQTRELDTLRAAVAAGTVDSAQLDREIKNARLNLHEMEQAADGAAARYNGFKKARRLVAVRGGENIDDELAVLSERIAQMRQVADDLSEQI